MIDTMDNTFPIVYKNGNYMVEFLADGTKSKTTFDDYFDADFPDSIDLKITDYCDMFCPMCHENSTPQGKHADLSLPFINTLHKGMEVAIGGGNPLAHPGLEEFLQELKSKGVICNLTVNEKHFLAYTDRIKRLCEKKFIYGLGISLNQFSEEAINYGQENENVVFHLICGIVTQKELELLANKNLKLLLLGYKKKGRGEKYFSAEIENNIAWLKDFLPRMKGCYRAISMDNLAIEQLSVRQKICPKKFATMYMGEEGTCSMYIDLVNKEYSISSTCPTRYKIEDNIDKMFANVKEYAISDPYSPCTVFDKYNRLKELPHNHQLKEKYFCDYAYKIGRQKEIMPYIFGLLAQKNAEKQAKIPINALCNNYSIQCPNDYNRVKTSIRNLCETYPFERYIVESGKEEYIQLLAELKKR